ncbi:MAG: VWA domain-containing protein [Gammaproteobacteria bacterium]|jgi:Skp family chaperone for outer membrane proteins|nr:VWA domain-containing protein [Gammaproteobacteria bacterium]
MKRQREEHTFSLSFLDVMSVGLGSVILLFLIINHASEQRSQESYAELQAAVGEQQARFIEYQYQADELGKSIQQTEAELQAMRANLDSLSQQLEQDAPPSQELEQERARIRAQQQQVSALEKRVAELREQSRDQENNANIERVDDGERQYLTGLKINGNRILFLVDASASMLSPTIVGAIRRRNMSDDERRASPKWQRALATVQWLAAQMPANASFQIYVFNHETRSVLPDTTGTWLKVQGEQGLAKAMAALREIVPGSGTSLYRAFAATAAITPRTDNIYLITDGLPTQGLMANEKGLVSARRRLTLFSEAIRVVPRVVPVNTILLSMEGDPMAASAFWHLSQLTGGVMLSPTEDWP